MNEVTTVLFWALILVNLIGVAGYWWLARRTATKTKLTDPPLQAWVNRVGVLLIVWAVGAVVLVNGPLFIARDGGTVRPFGALLIAPLTILFCNALLLVREQRTLIRTIPLHWAILVHAIRIPAGSILLLLLGQGMLPAAFGYEAGIGDITAGFFALVTAYLAAKNTTKYRPWILLWNAFGALDLLNALRLAVLVLTPFFNATGLPALVGILPAMAVPLLLSWHAYIFVRLLRLPAADSVSFTLATLAHTRQ